MRITEHARKCGLTISYFAVVKRQNPKKYQWLLELGNGSVSNGYIIASEKHEEMKHRLCEIDIEAGKHSTKSKIKLIDIITDVCNFSNRATSTQFINKCYMIDTRMHFDTYFHLEEILKRWSERN